MPILGIYVEKCTICKLCIQECPTRNFRIGENQKAIIFNNAACILCGHCIAVCPEDAISYNNMEDHVLEFKDGIQTGELISYDSIYQLFRSKRSIRQYKKKEVPHNLIEKVIDSMRY
ncbi:MAG: 4Fe-4S dicluster domain-containing protein, partial [Candidatus Hodarchaeota archaeon]